MSKGTYALGTIVGRMGKDIEVRTPNGKKIGSMSLACTSGWGGWEKTSWFNISIFDERKIELLEKYAGKGTMVMAVGELQVRKWQDRDGGDRYATELIVGFEGTIQLLGSKEDRERAQGGGGGGSRQRSAGDDGRGANREDRRNPADDNGGSWGGNAGGGWGAGDDDDDIPF